MSEMELRSNFRESRSKAILASPEFSAVSTWYREQLKTFGEMGVKRAPLTDGEKWKAELTDGEVNKVEGDFFTLEGQAITKYNADGSAGFGWTQPGLIQKEGEVGLPTENGIEKVKISGFVGVIKDGEGNILLSLAQEPFAHTPKKVVARTPFQTSAAKLQGIIDGNRDLDPQLFDLMESIAPGKEPVEVLKAGVLDVFPLPYADANRVDATNLGFILQITDNELAEKLTNNGKNRWCSPRETSALAKAGILNGHTSAAVLASL